MQGREADIIIYDLTDGSQKSHTYFLKTNDLNIHNVAITRSKKKLVFIADKNKLLKLKSIDDGKPSLLIILDKLINESLIIDGSIYKDKVIKFYDDSNLINDYLIDIKEEDKKKIIILNSSIYYPFLRNDLQKATESVIVISPFVTSNRWLKLKEDFINLKKRNVQITIHTKTPDSMFGTNKLNMQAVKILNEFIDLGFNVKSIRKNSFKVSNY